MEYQDLILDTNEKIDEYGKHFIQKMFYLFLTDKNFLSDTWEILDTSLFESNVYIWYINKIKEHFDVYKTNISIEHIEAYIESDDQLKSNDKLKKSINIFLIELLSRRKENFEFVKEKTTEFFKRRFVAKVINNCIPLIKEGKYDEIVEKIKEAARSGTDRNMGMDFLEDIELRYNEKDRKPVPTGTALDNRIGGLADGELGIILANSSVGKTWLLELFAVNAAKAGYNVVYYTLEDTEAFHLRRIDRIATHVHKNEAKNKIDVIKKKLTASIKGKMKVKHFPPEITSTNTLMAHLNKLKLYDFEPDIVFVDYGDQMVPNRSFRQDWKNEKQVFDELKSMADIEDIPVWTASQANRGGLDKDVLDVDNIGGAYGKVAPANILITASRQREDKEHNGGNLFLAKNKDGVDSIVFNLLMKLDRGIIEITESSSTYSSETNNEDSIKKPLYDAVQRIKYKKEDKV